MRHTHTPFTFHCFTSCNDSWTPIGFVDSSWCHSDTPVHPTVHLSVARADVWWYCGGTTVRGTLPELWYGRCILVSFIMPITIQPVSPTDLTSWEATVLYSISSLSRLHKRDVLSFTGDSPVYFDAIGQPRNIPYQYKLSDEVKDGFAGAFVVPFKNSERINYVHYNVQRLANFTRDAHVAAAEQLSATSLTSYQNRVAVDFLLADRGGVCSMFQDTCCTYIPNNTAPDGSLTRAIEGLRSLSIELKEASGIDDWFQSWLESTFGKWRAYAMAAFVSTAVFLSLLITCGCCCIPCIRALCVRLIDRTVSDTSSLSSNSYTPLHPIRPPPPPRVFPLYDNVPML